MTLLDQPIPALFPSRPDDEAPGGDLPRQVASRALTQAAALLTWGWLVTAPVVIVLGPDEYDVPGYLTVVGGLAVLVGAGTLAAIRRPQRLRELRLVALVAVAAALAAFDVLGLTVGSPANPAVSLMATTCLVAGLVLRLRWAAAAALALALWQCWWDVGSPLEPSVSGSLQVLLTAAGAVLGARFVARSLVRSSVQVSQLVARLLDERRAEQARQIRERSLVAARADLHDTVLTTLSGIAAGSLQATDPAALRAEFRRDLRMLSDLDETSGDEPVDLVEEIRDLTEASLFERLAVRVLAERPCPLPAVVADGLVLATREALVNVLKHAGTGRAEVTIDREGRCVRVRIRDDGSGFDPAEPRHGFGVAGIGTRLAEIGGTASVVSRPGAGTTVTLERPDDGGHPAGPVPPLWSIEGPRRGAMGLTVVAGVSQLLAFALQAGSYTMPLPEVGALLVALAVDVLVLLVLARSERLPGWLSAVLLVRIAVVLLLTGLPLTGCAAMGYQHFSAGGELITCIVITLLRPRREAFAAAAVYVVAWTVLAAPLYAAGQSCGITAVVDAAMVIGLVIAALAFVGALRRHAAIAAEVLAAEEALLAARTAQEVRTAVRRRLLPIVADIVAETLSGLADGTLDAADPEVRRACGRDARLLRSYLTRAGDGDHLITELFARSVQLRAAGVDLAVRGSLPRWTVPPEHRRALLRALDTCLATAIDAGWAGEGLVTVLQAAEALLVTLVLRAVPAGLSGQGVVDVLVAADADAMLELCEVMDDDLWVTLRGATAAAEAAR